MTREILAAGKPALFINQESVLLQFRGFMGARDFFLFLFWCFKDSLSFYVTDVRKMTPRERLSAIGRAIPLLHGERGGDHDGAFLAHVVGDDESVFLLVEIECEVIDGEGLAEGLPRIVAPRRGFGGGFAGKKNGEE